jgi:hypothetical protein
MGARWPPWFWGSDPHHPLIGFLELLEQITEWQIQKEQLRSPSVPEAGVQGRGAEACSPLLAPLRLLVVT